MTGSGAKESMDRPASFGGVDPVAAMEQSPGFRLLYRFGHNPEDLSVAKWQLDSACITSGDFERGILTIRTSGGATVTRRAEGDTVRKRPAIGEVTYASADTHARWTVEGSSEAMHVYIPMTRVDRFASDELETAAPPRIRDFFAVVDPWLQGYFQILASELEIFGRAERSADPLFLAQTEHLLLRHLLSWHADASASAGTYRSNPLPSRLMRRVQAYVDAHLADEICLADLADLACMSTGHFLRGFRVACGTTPYHYVLEQRLQRARSLLRSTLHPVSRIAVECGFKTLSHLSAKFHGRFGVSPTQFRTAARPRHLP
jgi:AraC family transcriptional regulator